MKQMFNALGVALVFVLLFLSMFLFLWFCSDLGFKM